MNNNYINQKLIKWCDLMYGKDSDNYSRCIKKKDVFVFGSKKLKVRNKLSKQFALLLVAGEKPLGFNKKIHFQITYLNLELNTRCLHSHGAVFDEDKAKQEIKLLKKEQKQLKKFNMPRTKTQFELKKVMIV